jgi:cytochrome c
MALSGHQDRAAECPLSGEKRTSKFKSVTSAFDPFRTSSIPERNHFRTAHLTLYDDTLGHETQSATRNNMAKKLIVAAALVAISSVPSMAQDAQKGRMVFNVCLVCHAIGPGAQNKIGPELNGLDGRKAGTAPNFDYSDANKNSGIVWNEETFADYIKNPAGKIPDTKMTFAGVKNEQQVKDLWAYISQFDAAGNIKK